MGNKGVVVIRKIIRNVKFATLLLVLALPVSVQAAVSYSYTTNNGTITITGCTGAGAAIIPETINGFAVTRIATSAIYANFGLTGVSIPGSVTNIGGGNFYICTNLTAITVDAANPNYSSLDGVLFNKAQTTLISFPGGKGGAYSVPVTVTNIVVQAFYSDVKVTDVSIPASVRNIGTFAFLGCAAMKTITVDAANPNYCSVDDVLFNKAQNTLIQFPGSKTGNYIVSANVNTISTYAFSGCCNLTAITVDAANPNYSSLDGVLFNKAQTTLIQHPGGRAGVYEVPASVRIIGPASFSLSRGLTNVTISNNVTRIDGSAFDSCSGLTSVTVPEGITSIADACFQNCSSLARVVIPKSVTSIVNQAFFQCRSLTGVTLPNSVTSIKYRAFWGCSVMTNVVIGSGLSSIGDEVFRGCNRLTGVYFNGNAPSLGVDVFASDNSATVYRLAEATGWPAVPGVWGGRPTALWKTLFLLTVTGGTGGGSYTNGQQVTVTADAPANGKAFGGWTGAVQYLSDATSPTVLVTMPALDISLTATYNDLYKLTVSGGTGNGSYTNGQRVTIAADAPAEGKLFDRWTGAAQYVSDVTAPTTLVTMPAADISLTSTYMTGTTNLPESRILLFDDYALTNNAPTPTWAHAGPVPPSFPSSRKALLTGTNHHHRTGWILRACRTGSSAYMCDRFIPPKSPATMPADPGAITNLAANMQNDTNAVIESPVFADGIGTVYFDAVNGLAAYPTLLSVEIATNMVSDSLGTVLPTFNPPSTDGYSYVWVSLTNLTLNAAASNGFIRYSRPLNCRWPVKLRLRRVDYQSGLSADNAFTVVDNIRVSPPPADVTVYNTEALYQSGYNTLRCFVGNADTNVPAAPRTVTGCYRWPDLGAGSNGWATVTLALVDAGDGRGNGERFEAVLPFQPLGGLLEYYFVCDFDGYRYQSPDYTGLGYAGYPAEGRSPFTTPVQTGTLAPLVLYALTVSGGTGGGTYTYGRQVTVTADAPEAGKAFDQWTGATQYLSDATSPTALVTMPAADVSLTATYRTAGLFTYMVNPGNTTVTVTGYNGSGDAIAIPTLLDGRAVTGIGTSAFHSRTWLTSVTIPGSVTDIGNLAFAGCTGLKGIYFKGNAPGAGASVFTGADQVTVYYLPGTTGWGSTFAGRPALLWNPKVRHGAGFGFASDRFGFDIAGTTNIPVVVEATTNLAGGVWTPLLTNILNTGSLSFTDPSSTNRPACFYRIVWP